MNVFGTGFLALTKIGVISVDLVLVRGEFSTTGWIIDSTAIVFLTDDFDFVD